MISHMRARRAAVLAAGCLGALLAAGAASAQAAPFIGPLQPNPAPIATTVPGNGDVNPYGIVTVPSSVGALHRGDLLVSNFNNSANEQGTGTTIVQIPPAGNDGMAGDASVFAQINPDTLPGRCPGRRGPDHGARGHPHRVRDRRQPAHRGRHRRPPPRPAACSC